MTSTLAPAGNLTPSPPGAFAATPASEKSLYYDADITNAPSTGTVANQGADVMRNPSVAAGALDSREPAGGGALAQKQGRNDSVEDTKGSNANGSKFKEDVGTGNVRDSGYAQAQDTKETPVVSETAKQTQGPDPSTAHVADGTKAPPPIEGETFGGPSDHPQEKQATGDIVAPIRGQSPLEGQTNETGLSPSGTEKQQVSGAFAKGAAVTSPDARPDEDITQHQRTETAENQMSEQAKKKISKDEKKDGKRLIKVIKAEGSAQKSNLTISLSELSRLQKVQKEASKDESNALSSYNKSTARAHTLHTKYLKSKAAYDQGEAEAQARKEALEEARKRAQDATGKLVAKTREAEELRLAKMVDDREREVRIEQLSRIGKKQQ